MGEIGIPKDIRNWIQNYALADVSARRYDRYEYLPAEKRRALEQWNRKLEAIYVSRKEAGNLVVLSTNLTSVK
jgi:hypothetical protein